VVLEGRRIKEKGSHDQLMALNGLYRRLYTVQKKLDPIGLVSDPVKVSR
jgi:ABC-type multidrug transport system fused ATPase/permease subunit